MSNYLKTKSKGFSLVELIISLVVASVLILMVGVLSNVAFTSHEDLRKESQVFNDVYSGFDLLTYSMRNALTVGVNYANNQLTLANHTLLEKSYDRTFKKDNTDFKYTDSSGDHIIIQGVNSLNFDFRCSQNAAGDWLPNTCSSSSRIFHITLTGNKDKESFNLFADVMRRN